MKSFKIFWLIGLSLIGLLLTGCGDKSHTLKCTLKDNSQEITMEIEFDDDEKEAQTSIMDIAYQGGNGITEEMLKDSLDSIKESVCLDSYKKCDVNIDGNKVTVHIEGTASNMSLNGSLEEIKTIVEEKGYTCE